MNSTMFQCHFVGFIGKLLNYHQQSLNNTCLTIRNAKDTIGWSPIGDQTLDGWVGTPLGQASDHQSSLRQSNTIVAISQFRNALFYKNL